MRVVLVTGSRDWTDVALVHQALTGEKPNIVIHGNCPTGADSMVDEWAKRAGITPIPMPAPWGEYAKTKNGKDPAGQIRNKAMVDMLSAMRLCGHKCKVLAFPLAASPGTRGCIKIAERFGHDVEVYEP